MTAAIAIACFLASLVGCEAVRWFALRRALFDVANERSLHTIPTPRLGGVAIVVVSLGAGLLVATDDHRFIALCVPIALVGLRDDIKPMRASVRLVIHAAAAIAFLALFGIPPLVLAPGLALPIPALVVAALLVIWTVGVLNIYNFMDGMDGLAGSQALFAAGVMGLLLASTGHARLGLVIAAAAAGFLAHNAPPARMFMGDAGATFLGFAFACLAVFGLHAGIPIPRMALPLAPFLLDGTFTIFRRLSKGEKIWTAHRSHLYQRAVQTGLGHRDVLLVYLGWMSACGIAALVAESGAALAGGWAVAVAGAFATWRWVVNRELSSQKAA